MEQELTLKQIVRQVAHEILFENGIDEYHRSGNSLCGLIADRFVEFMEEPNGTDTTTG